MKKILISNDDGIQASGILSAKKAVETLGEILVVAPENQQSGVGHSLTLLEPLRVKKHFLRDDSIGYGVTGTPTDSVIMGLFHFLKEKPDLMISGINTGFNLSKGELTTSGTLGAALEAASFNIPSIAISLSVNDQSLKFTKGKIDIDFEFAKKQLKKITKIVLKKGLPSGVDLININIPSKPTDDEIVITNLCNRMYNPIIEERLDLRGIPYYWIDGELCDFDEVGSDGYELIKNMKTTITPLKLDLTTNPNKIKKWFD